MSKPETITGRVNTKLSSDTEEVPAKSQKAFTLPGGVDVEMVDMQNGIVLKARSRNRDFWGPVSKEKFPPSTSTKSECLLWVKLPL